MSDWLNLTKRKMIDNYDNYSSISKKAKNSKYTKNLQIYLEDDGSGDGGRGIIYNISLIVKEST